MANIKSAKKRARQADDRYKLRHSQRAQTRTAIKKVVTAIEAGDKPAAQEAFKAAQPIIDRIADKKVLHKNKAARHKSRLQKAIKSMA